MSNIGSSLLNAPRYTAWMKKSENNSKQRADAKFMKDRPGMKEARKDLLVRHEGDSQGPA